jgi:trehalose 6-phosphate phosphatase
MDMARLERPPKLDVRRVALFLDLDGTIAEIAALPGDVGPLGPRNRLLQELDQALDGRIAVLTGRTLEEADRILDSAVPTIAAVHGLVWRRADGTIQATEPSAALAGAQDSLAALARACPGLIVEEKGASLALHYRQAPQAEAAVLEATARIAGASGLTVQNGAMVSELRTPGPDKGDSLRALMADPTFAGATPVMVGDDLTDEHGFSAAADMGGYGVLVGSPRETRARFGLSSVSEVLAWLKAALP